MTSKMAMEDVRALQDEGCVVPPEDVVRLNALGLKIEKKPDFRFATLPRVALCGNVLFREPSIGAEIFLDSLREIYSSDPGTILALEAYVYAHPETDWLNPPRFPRLFALRCVRWIRKHLKRESATKVRHALDYCKFGCNPEDGEYPVYATDETFDRWYGEAGPLSVAMRRYIQGVTYGIAPEAVLRATSQTLTAMLERAAMLNDLSVSDDEKKATAEYYMTLDDIKKRAYAERDARRKSEVTDGKSENHA